MSEGASKKKQSGYNLMTSFALIMPLFLIYQIGVLLTWPLHNGADLITGALVSYLDLVGYIAFQVAIVAIVCVMAAAKRKEEGVQFKQMGPLLLESAIYAFLLGTVIIVFMLKVLHLTPPKMGAPEGGTLDKIVMSAGAGVHEELLFRLLLMNGIFLAFKAMKFENGMALLGAMALQAAAFSAVHHIGPYGDNFSLWVFTFRFLAGVIFGVIYWWRGFAVAVYTHALYDMYVMIFR